MKKKTRYVGLYLLYILTAVLGNVLYSNLDEAAQKTYEGSIWIVACYSLTFVAAIIIIAFRTLLNTSLHEKGILVLDCVLCFISAFLFTYSLLSLGLYTFLPLKQDWFPYLMLIILTSDIFNLIWQLKPRNIK